MSVCRSSNFYSQMCKFISCNCKKNQNSEMKKNQYIFWFSILWRKTTNRMRDVNSEFRVKESELRAVNSKCAKKFWVIYLRNSKKRRKKIVIKVTIRNLNFLGIIYAKCTANSLFTITKFTLHLSSDCQCFNTWD